jgi:pathogenesis-related protein 1
MPHRAPYLYVAATSGDPIAPTVVVVPVRSISARLAKKLKGPDDAAAGAPPPAFAPMLALQNARRASHGAPPLAWSANLAAKAQESADACRLASKSKTPVELAAGASTTDAAAAMSAAVDAWYRQGASYDWAESSYSASSSAFTLLVWSSTTHVGCGFAACSAGVGNAAGLKVCAWEGRLLAAPWGCRCSVPFHILEQWAVVMPKSACLCMVCVRGVAHAFLTPNNHPPPQSVVVCHFAPVGNVAGSFSENVGPLLTTAGNGSSAVVGEETPAAAAPASVIPASGA